MKALSLTDSARGVEFNTFANISPATCHLSSPEEGKIKYRVETELSLRPFHWVLKQAQRFLCNLVSLLCFYLIISSLLLLTIIIVSCLYWLSTCKKKTHSCVMNNTYDDDAICLLLPLAISLLIKLITLEMRFANYLTWSNTFSTAQSKFWEFWDKCSSYPQYGQSTRILIFFAKCPFYVS